MGALLQGLSGYHHIFPGRDRYRQYGVSSVYLFQVLMMKETHIKRNYSNRLDYGDLGDLDGSVRANLPLVRDGSSITRSGGSTCA